MPGIDFSSEFGKRALDRLGREEVVWLTTVNAKGDPQPSPVWFLWEDDSVLIYSQPDTPKTRSIAINNRVALNFNSTETGGDVVVLNGIAEILDSPAANDVAAYIEKYARGLASLNMSPRDFASSYSVPIRVTPTRLRGF